MRFVPVKTADQQAAAVLLHRGRERLMRQGTGLVNALSRHLGRQRTPKPDRSTRHQLSDRAQANTSNLTEVFHAEFPNLLSQILET